MAEWPKTAECCPKCGLLSAGSCARNRCHGTPGHAAKPLPEVIPANLGRELYEALKEMEIPPFSRQLNALARYEREVGE